MPEVHFRVHRPDVGRDSWHSRSTVIKDFFVAGQAYPLDQFLQRSRSGLNAASERVRALYGMSCSRALGQLAAIEAKAKSQPTEGASVLVEAFSA